MPERLPIYEIENDIIAALGAARRLVLQAPTGSGKSTQAPQMLLKHGLLGNAQVVTLQPRRFYTYAFANGDKGKVETSGVVADPEGVLRARLKGDATTEYAFSDSKTLSGTWRGSGRRGLMAIPGTFKRK